jgi:hypothetical protein
MFTPQALASNALEVSYLLERIYHHPFWQCIVPSSVLGAARKLVQGAMNPGSSVQE